MGIRIGIEDDELRVWIRGRREGEERVKSWQRSFLSIRGGFLSMDLFEYGRCVEHVWGWGGKWNCKKL